MAALCRKYEIQEYEMRGGSKYKTKHMMCLNWFYLYLLVSILIMFILLHPPSVISGVKRMILTRFKVLCLLHLLRCVIINCVSDGLVPRAVTMTLLALWCSRNRWRRKKLCATGDHDPRVVACRRWCPAWRCPSGYQVSMSCHAREVNKELHLFPRWPVLWMLHANELLLEDVP